MAPMNSFRDGKGSVRQSEMRRGFGQLMFNESSQKNQMQSGRMSVGRTPKKSSAIEDIKRLYSKPVAGARGNGAENKNTLNQ